MCWDRSQDRSSKMYMPRNWKLVTLSTTVPLNEIDLWITAFPSWSQHSASWSCWHWEQPWRFLTIQNRFQSSLLHSDVSDVMNLLPTWCDSMATVAKWIWRSQLLASSLRCGLNREERRKSQAWSLLKWQIIQHGMRLTDWFPGQPRLL